MSPKIETFPPKVRKALEDKGFFGLTTEQRKRLHDQFLKEFAQSSRGDQKAEKSAVRKLRGD